MLPFRQVLVASWLLSDKPALMRPCTCARGYATHTHIKPPALRHSCSSTPVSRSVATPASPAPRLPRLPVVGPFAPLFSCVGARRRGVFHRFWPSGGAGRSDLARKKRKEAGMSVRAYVQVRRHSRSPVRSLVLGEGWAYPCLPSNGLRYPRLCFGQKPWRRRRKQISIAYFEVETGRMAFRVPSATRPCFISVVPARLYHLTAAPPLHVSASVCHFNPRPSSPHSAIGVSQIGRSSVRGCFEKANGSAQASFIFAA